jgi:hypothetical protein
METRMTWREKLLWRVMPLWAGAAFLFLSPHACRAFDPRTTRWGTLLSSIALLFPLAWAVYGLTATRTWRGLVAAGAAFVGIGSLFFLSTRPVGFHTAAELPFLAAAAWLVVAVRTVRDPDWRWANARRTLRPGWPMLGFVALALFGAAICYAWDVTLSMREWGFRPDLGPGAIAWDSILVISFAMLFQIAHKVSRSFTARSAISLAATAYALCAVRGIGHFTFSVFTRDLIFRGISEVLIIRMFVFLFQDELARQLPGVSFMSRQRACIGWRVLTATGVAVACVFSLWIWNAYRWEMSVALVIPATAIAAVVFCHLAIAARLPVGLVAKLAVSGLAIFASMDLVLSVAPNIPRFMDTGLDGSFLRRFVALRNGLTAFAVVGWSALCVISHIEYRGMLLTHTGSVAPEGNWCEAEVVTSACARRRP